jgi:Rps23 Pro-64 3,4-dihydroxylase Tpa1-like proline 4-hydroxylase
MMTRRFLLEAEEDEETEKAEEEPEKLKAEEIDVENFLDSVMRLVDNYDALLEIRNTILRRAINFLIKGYEPAAANAFKENLQDVYGIEVGKSKSEIEDEDFQAPAADRAGASQGA